jgi:hypothetical protein
VDPQDVERGEGKLMDAETKQQFENLTERFENLTKLMYELHGSVIREVGEVKEIVARMSVRLDKIAAGTHYVSKLTVCPTSRTNSNWTFFDGCRRSSADSI